MMKVSTNAAMQAMKKVRRSFEGCSSISASSSISLSSSCTVGRSAFGGVSVPASDFSFSSSSMAVGRSMGAAFLISVSGPLVGSSSSPSASNGRALIARVMLQSKFCGLMRDTTTVTMRPVMMAAILPAKVEYSSPVLAIVISPKY